MKNTVKLTVNDPHILEPHMESLVSEYTYSGIVFNFVDGIISRIPKLLIEDLQETLASKNITPDMYHIELEEVE